MNILIACEESQEVCKALRKRGHNAFSCDIQDCSGGHPEWHIKGDVLPLLNGNCIFHTTDKKIHIQSKKWDMIIAFPPCTYMTNASAVRMFKNGHIDKNRYLKAIAAKEFFMKIYNADCDKIAIENPTPMKIIGLPKYSAVIQPYEFGHPYSKRTCLWLKGLPPLLATDLIINYEPYVNGGCKDSHGNYRKFSGRSKRDSKNRSKTFHGIAEAMADQWAVSCISMNP